MCLKTKRATGQVYSFPQLATSHKRAQRRVWISGPNIKPGIVDYHDPAWIGVNDGSGRSSKKEFGKTALTEKKSAAQVSSLQFFRAQNKNNFSMNPISVPSTILRWLGRRQHKWWTEMKRGTAGTELLMSAWCWAEESPRAAPKKAAASVNMQNILGFYVGLSTFSYLNGKILSSHQGSKTLPLEKVSGY